MKRMRNTEGIHNAGSTPEKKLTIVSFTASEVQALVKLASDEQFNDNAETAANLIHVLTYE